MSRDDRSTLSTFAAWCTSRHGREFGSYRDLWEWSTADLDRFWAAVWEFFEVRASVAPAATLGSRSMPGAAWFPGARLNYAEQVCTGAPDGVAVVAHSQTRPDRHLTSAELRDQVAAAAAGLRRIGVRPGERVVGYLPNIPEALVLFLATASLGAVWAAVSPEFGAAAVVARFAQVRPTVLLAVSGYRWGSRDVDRAAEVARIRAGLPSLRAVVGVPYGRFAAVGDLTWDELVAQPAELVFEQVPFDHPLYVLYSSGTTGLPKAIVHGHGGITLEHLKLHALHLDSRRGDRLLWITTTAWTMWNILVSGLLVGAAVVLVDGDPVSPGPDDLRRQAATDGISLFGVSPGYVAALRGAGGSFVPWPALRTVGVTGAPLGRASARWLEAGLGPDRTVNSISGGTDVCSALVGGNPWVRATDGELSAPCLGVDVAAFDPAGRPVLDEVGELVVRAPMPSMPVGLWGDEDGSRYRDSYFARYPGIWRHGDWVTHTRRGTFVIEGRSDATLNRGGVRLGTSEFYATVEEMADIDDSMIVHLEDRGGEGPGHLLLFVVLRPGAALTPALEREIVDALRRDHSPRHRPDHILAVPQIPRTLTGKKLEAPLKQILGGRSPESVVQPDSVSGFAAIPVFVEQARRCIGAGPADAARGAGTLSPWTPGPT